MTRTELISALAEKTGFKKSELKEVFDTLADVIKANLKALPAGGKIVIPGVVTLHKRLAPARPSRMGRNPATGESIRIPAKPARLDVKAKLDGKLKASIVGKSKKKH